MASRGTVAALMLCAAGSMLVSNFRAGGSTVFLAPPSTSLPVGSRSSTNAGAGSQDAEYTFAGETATPAGQASTVVAFAVLASAAAVAAARRSTHTRRQAVRGIRDTASVVVKHGIISPYPLPKNYLPGERGYSMNTPAAKPLPPPARQSLSRVEDAMATMTPSDFYKAPFAKLSKGDVKTVGTCTTEGSDVSAPAAGVPAYVHPKVGIRMEKERGEKRPPIDDEKYMAYVGTRCTLKTMAEKAASGNLSNDFVVDRSVLTVLLDYVSESLTTKLKMKGQSMNPIDLVKITKESGKGLVLERLFEKKNLWAERRGYRGAWKRSEVSNNGTFSPAWQRLATGDVDKKSMMVTGLQQIAGSRAGKVPSHYQFVECKLGGVSMLTRARTDASADGKAVELKHKNWYFRQELTMLDAYLQMLLGGIDMQVLGVHRSGKVVKVVELTIDELVAKEPKIVDAAERRLGRLAALLEKVKGAVTKDGQYVLQWQNGELVLGDYVQKEPEEQKEQTKVEVEA